MQRVSYRITNSIYIASHTDRRIPNGKLKYMINKNVSEERPHYISAGDEKHVLLLKSVIMIKHGFAVGQKEYDHAEKSKH